jgi:glutaredoxin
MKSSDVKFLAINILVIWGVSLLSPELQAQTVYRIVGPDGKVTFSDKPPPPASEGKVSETSASSSSNSTSAGLPFELRQVATKYPVTLYAGDNCAPCNAGRSMLTSRGVPFSEKTVTTNEDAEALQRLSGDNSLPFTTIGSQQLKGFSDAEWTQFLNAAGYPTSSALPPRYRRPSPTPLVRIAAAPAVPAAATAPTAGTNPRPAPRAAQPATNPAGIRF